MIDLIKSHLADNYPIIHSDICDILLGYAIKFGFKSTTTDTGAKAPKSKNFTKAQRNIFSTCLIMVAAFMLCWSMYCGTIVVAALKSGYILESLTDLFHVADLLLEVNSAINPIIYALR